MRLFFTLTFVTVLGAALALLPSAAVAETVTTQRISGTKRLVPLKKITVGPDDQYDAVVSPDGRYIVYTHKVDLVAHLRIQSLATGEFKDLLPVTADSQEPSFAPDGRLVFSYFRYNARGDVCYLSLGAVALSTLKESDVKCLKRAGAHGATQRSNPFWRSRDEIGYLERAIEGQNSSIVSENVASGARVILAQGKVWSPQMQAGGRYLAFNEWVGDGGPEKSQSRHLVLKDLTTGGTHVILLKLPGMSGFPEMSDDEKYLYFSHFINDTNDDHTIDGSDNAVVFRLPVEKIIASGASATEIFPEQLTSVEESCSFPTTKGDSVYVTCAFEGSLDVYQMPSTGIVPADWDQARLDNAVATARSYQDRILLLNSKKYRFQPTSRAIDELLIGEHVLSDDTLAARYFLDRVRVGASENDRHFYDLLKQYLIARELKRSQPSSEVSREFRRQISQIEDQVAKLPDDGGFRTVVRGWLKAYVNETREGESVLKSVKLTGKVRPLARVIWFALASDLYRRDLTRSLSELTSAFVTTIAAPEMNEQSQVYYGYSLLKQIADAVKSLPERLALIERLNKNLPKPATLLLQSEVVTLKLIQAPDDAKKFAQYNELDKLMIASKADYFVKRALYVRSITNFADAADFKFLGFIADNWMRYTAGDDTEFAYAREAFSLITLDRAYANLGPGPNQLAASYFYQALSLTDDLEAHYGFIQTLNGFGQRKVIDDRYKSLVSQKLVDDNMKFVEASLILIDEQPKAEKDPKYVDHLDRAIAKLQAMQQDRDSAVRYLLLGSCYAEKLLRLANGYDFDAAVFQEAQRNLMLAYDLGRDNERVRASALMNLGIVNSRVQNYGLASRFFSLRKKLGFRGPDDQMRFAWLFSHTLDFSHQAELAAVELDGVPPALRSGPIEERHAFYLMDSGQYKIAADAYQKLLAQGVVTGDRNLAVVNLAYGFSALKAKRDAEASAALSTAIRLASGLKKEKRDESELIDFEPVRVLLAAYGLRAQVGRAPERAEALEQRAKLLADAKKIIDDWQPQLIQNRWQSVEISPDSSRAAETVGDALALTQAYAEKNQYLGNTVFRSTANGLAYGLRHPGVLKSADVKNLHQLVDGSLKAVAAQKQTTPVLDMQKYKLQILAAAFAERVEKSGPAKPQIEASVASAASLKIQAPEVYREIESLGRALE